MALPKNLLQMKLPVSLKGGQNKKQKDATSATDKVIATKGTIP